MKEVVDYGIIGFLIFLLVIVIVIVIERLWFFVIFCVDDYIDRCKLELVLYKWLILVVMIGFNVFYIGFLGMVMGIMFIFMDLGLVFGIDIKVIMINLVFVLKVIGMGLLVVIFVIVIYNLLVRKSEILVIKWDIFYYLVDM